MNFEKTLNLDVTGSFEDFTDFYNSNIETIYNEIIECFKEFKDPSIQRVRLLVKAQIQSLEWDTDFKFNRFELEILQRDLLPYYEENELFEKCTEIRDLYNNLNKINDEVQN